MNQSNSQRLAVLMTCHNRKSQTEACLKALKLQANHGVTLDVYLVDDGSTDGTAAAVIGIFPAAKIIRGDGNLYWCGGMRLAFAEAIKRNYDFYLWLNDDTRLFQHALARLFATYDQAAEALKQPTIVVGSTCDQQTGAMTYGGWVEKPRAFGPKSWHKISPDPTYWRPCDTINGNCVLIPRGVVERVGNLDVHFVHGIGDLDYGLRAKKNGCQIVIAAGYVGECTVNDGAGLWSDTRQPLRVRWNKLIGPKGLPVRAWLVFCYRHKGILWPLVWLSPYVLFWIHAMGFTPRKMRPLL